MPEGHKQIKSPKKWLRTALMVVLGIGIFWFGYGLGTGNISFSSNPGAQTASSNLNFSSVEKVYDLLRKNYDGKLEESKLLDGLKKRYG